MEEKKLEIFYDHYKDTFDNLKIYLQRRNNYTLICLLLIAAFSFQLSNPTQSTDISNELIKKNIGNITVDFSYISNVLTFALLWIVIMYFQINLLIEKQYDYIAEMETKLSHELKPFSITRESKSYIENYPLLSEIVHRIYTIAFPLTLIVVAIIKWFTEKNQFTEPFSNGHFWFDTIFLSAIIFISLLYFVRRQVLYFQNRKKKS